MSKRNTFRPTVQGLETRRLMAGDVLSLTGVDDPIIDGDQSTAVIADAVRVGNEDTSAEDDVFIDGKIITAENYDSAAASASRQLPTIKVFECPSDPVSDNDGTDAVFSELGSDTSGDAEAATWTFTNLSPGTYRVSTTWNTN